MQSKLSVLIVATAFTCLTACAHWWHRTKPQPATVATVQPRPQVNPKFYNLGYTASVRRGEIQYCKDGTPTGSRLYVSICHSEEELLQMEADTQGYIDDWNARAGTCANRTCTRRF
jgi:hypothetical protein